MYLWQSFTDSMSFIRYEVKSASRNLTHAFGKITIVVWIQSLWQPTANDTGKLFQAAEMDNIAYSGGYELANWNKIKARGDKCVMAELLLLAQMCAYALLQNATNSMTDNIRIHRKHMHPTQEPVAVSSLYAVLITIIPVRMSWWHCLCVSIKMQQKPTWCSKCLGNHGDACTKKSWENKIGKNIK